MVWDSDMSMMRGITFFEPDLPKYKTVKQCSDQGAKIIREAINSFKELKIKTGKWEIECIEVKGEEA